MYKALIELSADRAEFVSRLFSKPRPEGLSAKSTIQQIISGYWNVDTSEALKSADLLFCNASEAQAVITPLGAGCVRVVFDEAQAAITPGQAAVFYDGDRVVGGAWIEAVIE